MRNRLEHYFGFSALQTNWRTEILAGITTFITMAYVIFVNPSILSLSGMPIAAVTAATCLCAAFGSILMGALANYPLALAPGMGLNAYFTYTVVLKMGIPWPTALGAVFLSGFIFLCLTWSGIRQRLLAAIPHQLHAAVAGGIGPILMGALANYPLALAPGMGLNAYFTYTVVLKMGIPWPTALGAVFLSGFIFLCLTWSGIRQRLLAAIPHQLHAAVAGGIGLFIAFIGFRNSGIIVPSAATTVTLGNLRAPTTALALFGLLLIATLQVLRVRASMLIGVLGTMLLGVLCHQVHWAPTPFSLTAISATAFHLDIAGALHIGAFEIIFVFLFVDLFDNIGTLVAVTQRAGLMSPDHTIPRLNRIFFADASATVVGALAGTSTVTSYVESSAGVAAGGRTGVTAIVTGILFFLSLFVAPLIGAIPTFATAPALILVGALMLTGLGSIEWDEPTIAIPAFLTLVTIPLTWSIADGLSFGLTSYAALEIFSGKATRAHWMLYLLAALFLARFIYLAHT